MMAQIIFQIPFFNCPVIVSKRRYYLSTQECAATYSSGIPIFNFKEASSAIQVLYAITANTFGLEKIYGNAVLGHSKIVFMVIFFFLAMLQRHVWDHRYYNEFVENFFNEQTSSSYDRA